MLSNEKQIIYNIISRNIANLTSKSPLFWTFRDSISKYVFNYIEPYLDAFTERGKIDIEMTTDFAAKELNSKLATFKKEYKEKINENETDI